MNDENAKEITINRLPSITWNWLKMNGTVITDMQLSAEGVVELHAPDGIKAERSAGYVNNSIPTGAGEEFSGFLEEYDEVHTEVINADENIRPDDPVEIRLSCREKKDSVNSFFVSAGKNSDITVIMDIGSSADAAGSAAVQTVFDIKEGAHVNFVQVQKLGAGMDVINDVGARLGEGAGLDVIQLVLGGKDTYMGARADLAGDRSSFTSDIGYMTGQDEKLDINYIINHFGKKTGCDISASGVLRGNAVKTFRGTIDFKNGSAGSEGHERENVLLMDDDVHNKTIPVILCAEEDVVGTHGATIGRVDEELMFYLESRGMDHDQVYEMMANARIDAVVNKIGNDKVRKETSEFLHGPETQDD